MRRTESSGAESYPVKVPLSYTGRNSNGPFYNFTLLRKVSRVYLKIVAIESDREER